MILRAWPDPVLAAPCGPARRAGLAELAVSMVGAMRAHDGVGLAANQVGVPEAVFVALDPASRPPSGLDGVLVAADPVLVDHGGRALDVEGCLSVPGATRSVWRPAWVELEATGLDGRRFRRRVEGHTARIVAHELDHLAGRVLLDPATIA